MKKFLVTGGCGFIGSAFVRNLIKKKNIKVLNIDKLTYAGNIKNISNISHKHYLLKKIDINNSKKIDYLFEKFRPNIVINFAAESHVDRSINNSSNFINTNINGTYKLLEASRKLFFKMNSNDKKKFLFIQISTDEVYGDIPLNKSSIETDQFKPNSPYAASKAAADNLVRAWNKTYSLPCITTHCCNNFGPHQLPEKLIPLIISNAIEHKPLPVYGNGKQVREWIFVEDNINAIFKLIKKGVVGEHYNISSGYTLSNIDLIKLICEKLDFLKPSKKLKKYSSLISFVEDRPSHDKRYSVNSKKIRKICDWKTKRSFEEDLNETILWYIKNKSWFKNNKNLRKRRGLL